MLDFGEQGTNGWFYRYGNSKRPHRSERITGFDGEHYFQTGANGLEIKKNFVHTAQNISPILEWRAAENGKVNITVTYVKNVNGDANPSYPDGVQLMVYQGEELLKLEIVDISTETETFAQIAIDKLEVKEDESLYFVVDPRNNNAYDGGSLYVVINDVNKQPPQLEATDARLDNNANSVSDFGVQGSNGWSYMFGTNTQDCQLVSHEYEGEYLNGTSPNLSISEGFTHPSLNHNAVLGWTPAVNGFVDMRLKYTKFEQNDGNPDFPDGVTVRAYMNNELLYEEHVDAPAEGENKVKFRAPKLYVTPSDRFYFMVDADGNSSYDGGAFDITFIDVGDALDENSVAVEQPDTRQNFADAAVDFGPQGSNGWIFQFGYEDEPFTAYNMYPYDEGEERYFDQSWTEIKRDYSNVGEHGRSVVIKWRVAQNGTVGIRASYTKMRNEDSNPAWPDGTRVSLYYGSTLLRQEYFAPEVNAEVTKRLDVEALGVQKDAYITMVINGLENNAYDGGKYEFKIFSTSGLVGATERHVRPSYNGKRTNNASTNDDFRGKQGYNGWYYQYSYYDNPFFATNIELYDKKDGKYYTSDGVEIKKDYIVPTNKGKCAQVKWIAARNGRIDIDLEYTKLLNEDANPSYPDGVTVYLMHNKKVLKKQYFAPNTDVEVTKSLATNNVRVKKGDAITMIVDPGQNNAYDGGKYMFVIEDAATKPKVRVGNNDNSTCLWELTSIKQGTDGWWFLEGTNPSNAKVLTKKNKDKTGYVSRRTDGLEMRNGFVHTGATRNPIYQWVVGKNGKIDISGEYIKFGQEDTNPKLPDGVTVKIWHNGKQLLSKKVKVLRGDGKNNAIRFDFTGVSVKRGDKISFQVCADKNYAWDGGQLAVLIEPTSKLKVKPGDDNNTVLGELSSIEQGTDGWWFLDGRSPSKAILLTKKTDDGNGYKSRRSEAFEMKLDYVHPGATRNAIYMWVAAKNGKIDVSGSFVKFGQEHASASYPDGVTLIIRKNGKKLFGKKVKALRGDGNDNTVSFDMAALSVKKGDKLSFQIGSGSNYAWDGGRLNVVIEETTVLNRTPGDDNNTVLADISSMKQGTDGWWFMEGTSVKKVKPLTKLNDDGTAYISVRDSGLEMKRDYVHTGGQNSAFYQWVVKDDGTLDVKGSYVKYGHNDSNPDWPDGVTLTIYQNSKKLYQKKVKALQGDGNDNKVDFDFTDLAVKAGDIFSFQISPDNNNAWDAGKLSVIIGKEPVPEEEEPAADRTNNTVLADDFTGVQGRNGWYYGMCDWNSKNFAELFYDSENARYYNSGKPELKKDYVEPGQGRNAAYKWVAAQDGTIKVTGTYTKFANSEGNGTCMRIFVNGDEKKWMGAQGTGEERDVTFDETYEVKSGDEIIFAIDPDGDDAWDGGRLEVSISPVE